MAKQYSMNIAGIRGTRGQSADNIFIVEVTPEIARKMLDTMQGNRNLRKNIVDKYARDMESGNFELSPGMLVFDSEGHLIDGQHRLNAVIKSGKTITFYVMVGAQRTAVIDAGINRTPGDRIGFAGFVPVDLTKPEPMSIANCYLGIKYSHRNVLDSEYVQFFSEHEEAVRFALHASRCGGHPPICKKAGIMTALMAAYEAGVPMETLEEFCRVANTGMAEGAAQFPAILLRNYIINTHTNTGTKATRALCAFAEMAIRDFTKGTPRRIKYLTLRHVYIDDLPETYPAVA